MQSSKYIILGGGMVAGYAAKEMIERGPGSRKLLSPKRGQQDPKGRRPNRNISSLQCFIHRPSTNLAVQAIENKCLQICAQ